MKSRFVARASRRAASTVVSTFFSAVTPIRIEVQREINALARIFDGAVEADFFLTQTREPGAGVAINIAPEMPSAQTAESCGPIRQPG
jgi:hypothetical protein